MTTNDALQVAQTNLFGFGSEAGSLASDAPHLDLVVNDDNHAHVTVLLPP